MLEQTDHPSPAKLNAFSLGQLPPAESALVEDHISECQPCCETMLDLSSEDTFAGLLKEARQLPTDQTLDLDDMQAEGDPSLHDIPAPLAEHPRYNMLGLIGKGGMGDVYKARHRMMDRMVALKVINRELVQKPEAVDRFHREVKTAARLSHPNIVTAYDAEQAGDVHFLVMEHVDGVDLSQIVKDRGALSVAEACNYIRQAAIGLQHAHERGMVHRDVKPHNLMVTADGTVKILDFGLASLAPQASPNDETAEARGDLTATGAIMGTPDFISPEQAKDAHQADIRSDIYSLGTTLYFLLSGRPPFVGGSVMHKLKSHAQAEPEALESLREDIPAELAAVVSKMIAKAPDQRFQTPAEVAAALAPFSRASQPAQETQHQPRRRRSRLLPLTAIATLFVATIVAAVVYYVQTDYGTVRVEVIDESLQATISGQTITMKDGNQEPLEIRAGECVLVVRQGDFEFETDSFQIRRNESVVFKVERLAREVVVSKDGERFDSMALSEPGERNAMVENTQSRQNENPQQNPLNDRETSGQSSTKEPNATQIMQTLTAKHGNLAPKLQKMIGEAAGIPNPQWQKFAADPNGSVGAIKGEPLSLVLWKLNPLEASTKNLMVLEDFRYLGGIPKPKQLSDAMFPSQVHGYYSMIQPHYISGLTYDLKRGGNQLKGSFRFQAPNLYAGKIDYVVQIEGDDLRVIEFILPNCGIRLVRGRDGLWTEKDHTPPPANSENGDLPNKQEQAANTIRALAQILDAFKVQNGSYPTTEAGWNAMRPFLKETPMDPWGNIFGYEFPGEQKSNSVKPRIWSWGPDGKDNTADDVRNWERATNEEDSSARIILDQGYTIIDAGASIGSRRLVVTRKNQTLSIVEEHSLALKWDGAPLGIVECDFSADYSLAGERPLVLRGTTSTKEQGSLVMHGTVEFTGGVALTSWTSYTERGRKLETPSKQQVTVKPPSGPLVLGSTIQVVGPLLLPEDGEQEIVWGNFDDDPPAGKPLVEYQAGCKLRRTTRAERPGFTIAIFEPGSEKPEMTWEYDSKGICERIHVGSTTVIESNPAGGDNAKANDTQPRQEQNTKQDPLNVRKRSASSPINQIAKLLDAWKGLPDPSADSEAFAKKISTLHSELHEQLKPNTESSRQASARLAVLAWPYLSDSIPRTMAQTLADLTEPGTAVRMSDRLAEAGRPTEPLGWDIQATYALALARAGKTEEALRENQALMKKLDVNVRKGRLPEVQLEFLDATRSQKSLLKQMLLQKALILAIAGRTAESVDASTAAGGVEVNKPTQDDQAAIQAMLQILASRREDDHRNSATQTH